MPRGWPRGMACTLNKCRAKALRRSQGFPHFVICETEAQEVLRGADQDGTATAAVVDEVDDAFEDAKKVASTTNGTIEAAVQDAIREAVEMETDSSA